MENVLNVQPSWQQALKQAYRDPRSLCRDLGLSTLQAPYAIDTQPSFSFLVPQHFVAQMQNGNWYDPLLLQVLPQAEERSDARGILDPIGEHDLAQDGLIHKYHGRVLWILSGGCAVNCRYCFRRHFDYQSQLQNKAQMQGVLQRIAADCSIHEVILSGGDPLLLPDHRLADLLAELDAIEHVQTVRIHTRLPIVLPSRVTDSLLAILRQSQTAVVMVLHCNHAQEVSAQVAFAMQQLKSVVVALFNQSVLLRGVNDDVSVLCHLSQRLMQNGCIPYYMHLLDEVRGAMHFKVDNERAQALMREMQRLLPGYLVPRWVQDIAGSAFKQPL